MIHQPCVVPCRVIGYIVVLLHRHRNVVPIHCTCDVVLRLFATPTPPHISSPRPLPLWQPLVTD
ncbi:type I polyketide synthase [Sesbania bispinosa]|nr:type I polyketide synthase [Sesbania bispinosa]